MSSALDDADVATITVLLSPERLGPLTTLTGSTRAAIELHQETLKVSASLMNVIASIELALRNSVNENLTIFFGKAGWLTHPPAPFQWRNLENTAAKKALDSARRSQYSKLTQAEKAALDALAFPQGRPPNTSHIARANARRKLIQVTDGKVIAETTFHFWKRLYSSDYDQTLWRTTLKRTFPNKHLKRATVAEQLEHIYQARNRLAHHEPVLRGRFTDTVGAIEFVAQNLGMNKISSETPLSKMVYDSLNGVKIAAYNLHARLDAFRNT